MGAQSSALQLLLYSIWYTKVDRLGALTTSSMLLALRAIGQSMRLPLAFKVQENEKRLSWAGDKLAQIGSIGEVSQPRWQKLHRSFIGG